MAYSTARQVSVAFKSQSVIGTPETGAGATGFRLNSGGLNMAIGEITSGENRRDGMTTRSRHGARTVSGNYVADISLKSFDDLVAAVFWGAFDTAVTIDDATGAMSSATISVSSNVITASGGSFITSGLRVGDIVRLTEGFDSADHNKNVRLAGVTATTLTCERLDGVAMTNVTGPVSSWTIVRPRKVMQGTTRSAFTFEECEHDIDGSELFEWCRISSLAIELQPNSMATANFGIVGRSMETKSGSDSPVFTSPTYTTSQPLTAVEAALYVGTDKVVDLTALSLNLDRRAAGVEVVGSVYTPDVFDNTLQISGSITALRKDLALVASAIAEDNLSLQLVLAENESEPKDFISIHVPYVSLRPESKSEIGQDGPRTQTLALAIGADPRGGAYDSKMVSWQTSSVA